MESPARCVIRGAAGVAFPELQVGHSRVNRDALISINLTEQSSCSCSTELYKNSRTWAAVHQFASDAKQYIDQPHHSQQVLHFSWDGCLFKCSVFNSFNSDSFSIPVKKKTRHNITKKPNSIYVCTYIKMQPPIDFCEYFRFSLLFCFYNFD